MTVGAIDQVLVDVIEFQPDRFRVGFTVSTPLVCPACAAELDGVRFEFADPFGLAGRCRVCATLFRLRLVLEEIREEAPS